MSVILSAGIVQTLPSPGAESVSLMRGSVSDVSSSNSVAVAVLFGEMLADRIWLLSNSLSF